MAMPSPSPNLSSSSCRVVPNLNLPAGFRFHPTDEELIVHYLMNQAASIPCPVPIIAEVNIYQCNPWDLPAKAVFGESEWYFFSPRDRKYPNGARPNRAAGSGYWKATGTDKAIMSTPTGQHIGVKKALVYYGGRAPRGVKTDWIMHEYLLVTAADGKTATAAKRRGGSMRLDDWVLCRIHKKSNDFQLSSDHQEQEQEGSSTVEQESPKPEPLEHDQFQFHQTTLTKSCSLTDLLNSIHYSSALSQVLDGPVDGSEALPQQNPPLIYPTTTHETHQALNYNNNNNNNHLISLPHTKATACSADSVVANNCNNGVNKRKRMTTAAMNDGVESFDYGSNGFSSKPKVLPTDSRNSSHLGSTSSSSYCNQQVVDTSGLFQHSSLLSYPFLEMQ
ncbi:unnamed protein product [Miscanthus lutarioriparius]|uniref:NAC domain-containing protein n=1 Tax=Miscanthus lutarioriparius TaxID=422564 RepID=A0A811QR04_9POAL|nr:unnamed protein product [Miscanthus lutarioriparius]